MAPGSLLPETASIVLVMPSSQFPDASTLHVPSPKLHALKARTPTPKPKAIFNTFPMKLLSRDGC